MRSCFVFTRAALAAVVGRAKGPVSQQTCSSSFPGTAGVSWRHEARIYSKQVFSPSLPSAVDLVESWPRWVAK